MKISIKCPFCGEQYELEQFEEGLEAECEKCGNTFKLSTRLIDNSAMTSFQSKPMSSQDESPNNEDEIEQEEILNNSKLTQCPDCGKTISKRATICPFCGAPRQEAPPYVEQNKWHNKLKNCPNCGHSVAEEAYVCPKCGRQFSTYERTGIGSPLFCFIIFIIILFLIIAFSL